MVISYSLNDIVSNFDLFVLEHVKDPTMNNFFSPLRAEGHRHTWNICLGESDTMTFNPIDAIFEIQGWHKINAASDRQFICYL